MHVQDIGLVYLRNHSIFFTDRKSGDILKVLLGHDQQQTWQKDIERDLSMSDELQILIVDIRYIANHVMFFSVPPSAPVITVLSGDLTNGVQEGDELVLRCKAKVGSQGKGRLHWRVYRGNGPDIMSTDQRVNTSTSKIVLLTLYSTTLL